MSKKTIVVDLGGSILFPKLGQINWKLLKSFKRFIKQKGGRKRFILVVGGGGTARAYQKQARELKINRDQALDWIGIRATRLNAEFLKAFLGELAWPELVTTENQKVPRNSKAVVSGGWHPGNSTDYVAIKLAKKYKAEKVVIATNIDYVYDSDPKKNPRAKKFESMSWREFNQLFRQKWKPGMTVPLDPKAARLGQKINIPLCFLNGNNLINLQNAIRGKKFKGTMISRI